jgi:hypothetical protein
MNERIKELAKQANAWYPTGYPSGEGGDAAWQNLVIFEKEDLQKFAELIVRDCIKQLGKIQLAEGDQWIKDKEETYLAHTETICIAQNWIKESFGVKE